MSPTYVRLFPPRRGTRFAGAILALFLAGTAAAAAQRYPLGPDSQRQDVPHGTLTQHSWTDSNIFSHTKRDYWVYVPAQYDADKPACVMIIQDGREWIDDKGPWRIPVVFDNLIAQKAMPPTIGIFIDPGLLQSTGPNPSAGANRELEYDAISGLYAQFLIEEILPDVGKQYNLSKDPSDRAIGGAGSGGIAAFTAAWFRPNAFRRVLMLGNNSRDRRMVDVYPTLIRTSEACPLRVFLQSAKRDANADAGPFRQSVIPVTNTAMADAFKEMGYDCRPDPVEEDHGDNHGGAILPDALRWLWRGHPQPIIASQPTARRNAGADIVAAGKGWEPFGEKLERPIALAADRQGNLFVSESRYMEERILKFDASGNAAVFKDYPYDPPEHPHHGHPERAVLAYISPMTVGHDGTLYAYRDYLKQIVAYTPEGKESVVARDVKDVGGLAAGQHARLFYIDAREWSIRLVEPGKPPRVAVVATQFPCNLQLMPRSSRLVVGTIGASQAWSYQVMPDGQLTDGKPFCLLAGPAIRMEAMAADTEGRLYVGTEIGIQVFDPQGRLIFIMAAPPGGNLWHMAFGGPDFRTLYANAGYKLFRRRLKTMGIQP